MEHNSNWHQHHKNSSTFGQHLADSVATGMGSWRFIIIQSAIVIVWMAANVAGFIFHWDVYPFILLNLLFSTQAAYAAPIIMMAQNRQGERDRAQAEQDFKTNREAKKEIEELQVLLSKIEIEKLDLLIKMMQEIKDAKEKK